MHFVYVLYSLKDNKLYKGSTSDISKRLRRHNDGGNASTANRKPFVLIHLEFFYDKSVALKREAFIKTPEGGSKLKLYLKEKLILSSDGILNLEGSSGVRQVRGSSPLPATANLKET